MEERKIEQRCHYDRAARAIGQFKPGFNIGSKMVDIALAAPYQYCEKWLSEHCLNKIVLDYGCGYGIHSIFPAKNGARVVGLDISSEAIKVARSRVDREDIFNSVTFAVGDCESLPFLSDSFDIVLSIGNLSCLLLDKAYSEMARVLKPTGKVMIVDTLGYNPLLNLNRWIKYKRGIKLKQTASNTLKMNGIFLALKYFESIDGPEFFSITSPFLALFTATDNKLIRWKHYLADFFNKMDFVIKKIPYTARLSFKVVYVLSVPRKYNKLDYMKRAAPRCDKHTPYQTIFAKGGVAHEKDSLCRNRLPLK